MEQLGSSRLLARKPLIGNMKGVKRLKASECLRMWWEPVILGWLGIWWPSWWRALTKITAATSKQMSSFLSPLRNIPTLPSAYIILIPSFSPAGSSFLSVITKHRKDEHASFWTLSGDSWSFCRHVIMPSLSGKEIWENPSKMDLFSASTLLKSWH